MLNETQQQQELKPLLGAIRTKPGMVDVSLVARCNDEQEAILLCVHLSKLANEEIARQLGIDKGHWSRIMQGRGNLPERKRTQLMAICGNLAPLQFAAMKFGFKLSQDDTEEEERALKARLQQIDALKRVRIAA